MNVFGLGGFWALAVKVSNPNAAVARRSVIVFIRLLIRIPVKRIIRHQTIGKKGLSLDLNGQTQGHGENSQ